MVQAAIDAALEDTVMQGNLQQHPPSIQMSERLISLARQGGAKIDHCLLSTSGAMANENALKIAFHHKAPADRIIAFDNAFAGRTLAMASLTDRAAYRSGLPITIDVDYLPFRDPHHPERSQRWAVNELHRLLKRYPGRYAAFWAEPIAGEGGYYEGSHEFFARSANRCERRGCRSSLTKCRPSRAQVRHLLSSITDSTRTRTSSRSEKSRRFARRSTARSLNRTHRS